MHQDVNSNSRGSLLTKMEVESDSDVPEFSLPPKSIVKRPKKTIRKRTRPRWKKYCRKCCHLCSRVLLALVLCACVLSIVLLFWFSLRLYRDVENLSRRLTIEINRVQTEQITNVEKCTLLETKMNENMKVLKNGQNDILHFKKKIQVSFDKIAVLNETLLKMSHMLHSPNSKMSLSKTVNALKKGMADTGAEMTKLSDEIKQIGEATSSQSKAVRRIFLGLFNISSELANITGKSTRVFQSSEDYLQQKFQDESGSKKESSNGLLLNASDDYTQVTRLHSEPKTPEMKSSLQSTYVEESGNISSRIHRVERDMLRMQQLITRLKSQVGNLTQNDMNYFENSNQIDQLWQEVEWQNESIAQMRKILNENKSGMASRRESSMGDDFELFPDDRNPVPREQRRDTLRTRFKNLKSDSKYSHKFRDVIDDDIT